MEAGAIDFGRNDVELRHELQGIIGSQPMQHWVDLAIERRLPIGPAHQGVASLRDDPHVAARAVVTMCTALPSWWRPDGPLSAEQVADRYVGVALDMMRHRP